MDEVLKANKRDSNYSFNSFYDKIESIHDKHMPKSKITKEEFKQRPLYKPWSTFGLLSSMKRRDKLLKKCIKIKNYTKKQIAHNDYKTLRN